MTDLLGLLDEHVAENERVLFPAVRAFVSVADYDAAQARMRRPRAPSADGAVERRRAIVRTCAACGPLRS